MTDTLCSTLPPNWPIDRLIETPDGSVCGGCAVNPPFEHRCWGTPCECDLCTIACDRCGKTALLAPVPPGWYFGPLHPSDGLGEVLCPDCDAGAVSR